MISEPTPIPAEGSTLKLSRTPQNTPDPRIHSIRTLPAQQERAPEVFYDHRMNIPGYGKEKENEEPMCN
jgi:hypothetical protein